MTFNFAFFGHMFRKQVTFILPFCLFYIDLYVTALADLAVYVKQIIVLRYEKKDVNGRKDMPWLSTDQACHGHINHVYKCLL